MWRVLNACFLQGQGGSSRTPSFTLILQSMCLSWENAYKMNIAWFSVLLSLCWKPYIVEELLYTCLYMKDPTRSSKDNSEIVQLENLMWSLWGHSCSSAWKLLGFSAAWINRTWDRATLRCQATLENLLQISLYVSRHIAIDPYIIQY